MKFIVKNYANSDYKELVVENGAAMMESGLLDEKDRRQMAEDLQAAIDDLLCGLAVELAE